MTDIQEIRKLVGKWEAGETSSSEEKLLRDFFAGGDVPSDLEPLRVIFAGFSSMAKEKVPETRHARKSRIWLYAVSAAAAMALVLMVGRQKPCAYINGKPVYSEATALSSIEQLGLDKKIGDLTQPVELDKVIDILEKLNENE